LAGVIGYGVLVVGVYYWFVHVHPRPNYGQIFPYEPLAENVTKQWVRRFGSLPRFVAGDRWLAAGVSAYSKAKPRPYFDWNPRTNPWLKEDEIVASGAIFVHQMRNSENDTKLIHDLVQRYPNLVHQEIVSLPYLSDVGQPPLKFWVAELPPGSHTTNH
jgi:hypothetical protein